TAAAPGPGAPGPTDQAPAQPQPPTQVTHPLVNSKTILDYAKGFDTSANRVVYHPRGPGGEPGWTVFNKGGGTFFLGASQVAKNNPGLLLADNLGHGIDVANATT